ncbi:MAG: AMP-dependent synthetase/ligase [Solirubrobacteraceae bacterium]
MNATTSLDTTLTDQFAALLAERGDEPAIRTLDDSTRWTWNELDQRARRAATGLRALDVGAGDTVGLLLTNRPEFYVLDLACVMLGATPVSVYATSSPEQVAYIAQDGGFKLLWCDAALRELAAPVSCPCHVVEDEFEGLLQSEPLRDVHAADPSELLTIIYTSGTTGPPKGVELRHAELMFSTSAIGERHGLRTGERVICWLPMAHIAERLASYYTAIVFGSLVTICPDPRQIATYLKQVHPTWFFAVPRIWEKLKAGIEAQIEPERVSTTDPEVLAGIRAAVGLDQIHTASVGAAPIAPEVITFFHALGIPLAEIYGQSEGCACATCNPPDRIKIGTVGLPQPGVELRLLDDGEILIRGRNLMRGYRNQPLQTAEAIDLDGWLHTGDIGELDDDGYLRIVDRKKELIISAAGKNMSPSNIEAAIKTHSPLIGQIVAVGDRRPYNVALIALDPDALGGRNADDPDVLAEIEAAVEHGNARLSRVEQIKRFKVLGEAWGPGGEELTPTMKLKRKPITAKYAAEIEALYADG